MTVTYDITTNVGKVRLTIHDNDISNPVFTDEELTYFLTQNSSNINLASATALEAWAAAYGPNANSEKIGDYSYTQKIVDDMLALAKRLRDKEAGVPAITSASPGIDWAEMDLLDQGEVDE